MTSVVLSLIIEVHAPLLCYPVSFDIRKWGGINCLHLSTKRSHSFLCIYCASYKLLFFSVKLWGVVIKGVIFLLWNMKYYFSFSQITLISLSKSISRVHLQAAKSYLYKLSAIQVLSSKIFTGSTHTALKYSAV